MSKLTICYMHISKENGQKDYRTSAKIRIGDGIEPIEIENCIDQETAKKVEEQVLNYVKNYLKDVISEKI